MTYLTQREPRALEVDMLHARIGAGENDPFAAPQLGAVVPQPGGVRPERLGDCADAVELRARTQRRAQGRMASRAKRTRPLPVAIQM